MLNRDSLTLGPLIKLKTFCRSESVPSSLGSRVAFEVWLWKSGMHPGIHEAATSPLSPVMDPNTKNLIEVLWTSVICKSICDS